MKQELDIDFHKIPLSDLYQRLGTNADTGLTNAQVKHNLVKNETLVIIAILDDHNNIIPIHIIHKFQCFRPDVSVVDLTVTLEK